MLSDLVQYPLAAALHIPSTPPLTPGQAAIYVVSMDLPILNILYKWNHTIKKKVSAGEIVEKRGTLPTMLVGMYGAAMMENSIVWKVLKKLKIELPYNSAIPLLGIYPKKTKTLIWKQICTSIFTAALFTIAKIWKQPKCISVDEWVKKTWYICVTKYCLATKYKENFASV